MDEAESNQNSCPNCQLCFFHCKNYMSDHHIPDSVVPSHCTQGADSNFSWLTLPSQLVIKKSKLPATGVGVFPQSYIPAGTIFGPLVGQAYKAANDYIDLPCTYWKFKDGSPLYRIDCGDTRQSNWMRWVNTARRAQDTTAIVCECGGEIYFRTVIKLNDDMELLIGSVEDDLKVPIKGDCSIMLSADEILAEISQLDRTVDHTNLDKIDYMLHQTSLQDSGLMSIERSEPNDALERATSHTLEGWELKVVKRLSGQSLGKYDIYYYSPTREKFRSRIQLQKYIESKNLQLNLDIFTFSVKTLEALGYLKNPHKWPHKLNLPTKPNSHPVQIQRKPSQPNLRLRSLTRKKSDQNVQIQKKTLQHRKTEKKNLKTFRLRSFKNNESDQNVEIQKETPQPQQRSVKKNESEESELQKRKTDTANDLKGWRIKLVKRLTGQNAGKYDIYYFSPSDEKFRSRPELQKYVESNNLDLDLNQFKFSVKSLMSMRQNEEAHRWHLEVSDLQ